MKCAQVHRLLALLSLAGLAFLVSFGLTKLLGSRTPTDDPPAGMRWIPGGEFVMGSDAPDAWPDEQPAHRVRVDDFWIDEHEVTNAEFRAFVKATGYVTTAERPPDVEEILRQSPPGTPRPPDESLVPGSLVFTPPAGPVPLDDSSQWWSWTPAPPGDTPKGRAARSRAGTTTRSSTFPGTTPRRTPTGPASGSPPRPSGSTPRGGLVGQPYVWGAEPPSESSRLANIWQGEFPHRNSAADGFARTAPVGSYPPNGFGLHDMAGNVWEWCADWYRRDLYASRAGRGVVVNPPGPDRSTDPGRPFTPLRVQRGGSFLCNDGYCSRYRPSARQGGAPDTGMSHVGFRCASSAPRDP